MSAKFWIVTFIMLVKNCYSTKVSSQSINVKSKAEKLIVVLDTIWMREQEPIRLRDSIGRIYGFESREFRKQQIICDDNHRINEEKVINILDNEGWPSEDIVGYEGSLTICNVIQHSDFKTRLKYLPMMREAVRRKILEPKLLARAEDRIATDRGEPQVYGGQIKYYSETKSFNVWPIIDPVNVNERRVQIGLDSIEHFLKNRRTPIVWNLQDQIKRTDEFIKNR